MKIYVTRPIPETGLHILRHHYPDCGMNPEDRVLAREELLSRVKGVDGLLSLLTDRIDAELLDTAGPQLKIVANYAVGYNNIDVEEAKKRNIMVTNTPGILTESVAEHTVALIFAIAERIVEGGEEK